MHPISTLTKLLRTAHYLCYLALKEDFSNPFKEWQGPKEKPICVLGNGPSLKTLLADMEEDFAPYSGSEFFVVNDFVHDPQFRLIKPRYCAMSDPLFFVDTIYAERGHKAMESLAENVSWPMLLFVPWYYKDSVYLNPVRQNTHIRIVAHHSMAYWGLERFRHFFYRRGLGNGEFATVVLNALYAALMLGYKRIHVYGIDHTFFDNLVVNDDNVLCSKSKHFYKEETLLRPIICHLPGHPFENKPFTVADYLKEKTLIFKGHLIMEHFARSLGAVIINCTTGSLVDAYVRQHDYKMKISIVTVCYNAVATMERTMLSVLGQTYCDVEYIVIDGGSTDGTVDVIKKYADRLAYWVSEPDKGIYDAMNKGVRVATGNFVYFLGADDTLISDDILSQVAQYLLLPDKIYYGDVRFVPSNRRYGFKITKRRICLKNIPHQAIFYPRSVFEKYAYELRFVAYADYYLNLSCFIDGAFPFNYLGMVIANYTEGGFSAINGDKEFNRLLPQIIKREFGCSYYIYYRFRRFFSYLKRCIQNGSI